MPRDYYTNMLSLRADILIVTKLMYLRDKKLMEHFEEVGMDVSLILVESFITLFTTSCHPDLVDIIIDHFVIDGAVVLIKAMVLILSYFCTKLMKIDSFSDMLVFFKKKLQTCFVEPKKFSSDLMNLYLSKYLIEELREFYTMKERSNYYVNKPVVFNNSVKCKANWPICYQALETCKVVPETTKSNIFKSHFVMDNFKLDYFFQKRTAAYSPENDSKDIHSKFKTPKNEERIEEDDLLMDRQHHICPMKNKQYDKMKSEIKKLITKQLSNYNLFINSIDAKSGNGSNPHFSYSKETVKSVMKNVMNSSENENSDQDESSWSESQSSPSKIETPTKMPKKKKKDVHNSPEEDIDNLSLMLAR